MSDVRTCGMSQTEKAVERTKKPMGIRAISLKLAALLAGLAVAGTASALTINALTNETFTVFEYTNDGSDFSVTAFNTTINGEDEVVIGVTVKNNDGASAHFANVTVKLLDAAGDLADPAASITQATGSVAASGTSADDWTFSITGIVAAYTDVIIIVDQSS